MADTGAVTAYTKVVLDAQGRIGHDVHCIQCGYNLRGLGTGGKCPECGTAIHQSLRPDYLRFAQPDWVETLASGMSWIVWSIVVGILLGCVEGVGSTVLAASQPGTGGFTQVVVFQLMMQVVVGTMSLFGYWKLTALEPRISLEEGITVRMVVRFCMAIGYFSGIVAIFASDASDLLVGGLLTFINAIIDIVGFIALFIYAGRLARRIPDMKLAQSTRTCMWGVGASYFMMAAGGIFLLLSYFNNTSVVAGGVGGMAITLLF